jgi:putative NADPH-quinone reductase
VKRILLIQGHPDRAGGHFVQALATAYERGARNAGHEVVRVDIAKLDFGLLRSAAEWQFREPPAAIRAVQAQIAAAHHVVILFPLWLGDMPALLKGFFEQALRPGFALSKTARNPLAAGLLKGRSAHVIVTMGMPAFFYRIFYGAHSLKSLQRNILRFCGFRPVRTTVIGMVEGKREVRERWLSRMFALGRKAG